MVMMEIMLVVIGEIIVNRVKIVVILTTIIVIMVTTEIIAMMIIMNIDTNNCIHSAGQGTHGG